MAFSFLDWLISEALSTSLSHVKSIVSNNQLQAKINQVIDEWASKLPAYGRLVSVSMYLDINSDSQDANNNALKLVGNAMVNGKLPSYQMIFNALVERWTNCKKNGGSQLFFTLEAVEAEFLIKDLAQKISSILIQQQNLFTAFVQERFLEIENEHAELQKQVATLRKMIINNETLIKSSIKTFRPISVCRIPIEKDERMRRATLLNILKIGIFDAFKHIKYKKFICLINIERDVFKIHNQQVDNLNLLTGEIMFLSSCQNLVDISCENTRVFYETLIKYMDNDEFKSYHMHYTLEQSKYPLPYEIEVDNQTKKYKIRRVYFNNLIQYEKLASLNKALPFISDLLIRPIHLIDYDKISSLCPAMLKVIYNGIIDKKIDYGKIMVNVDDFDEWDYDYTLT